MSVFNQSRQNVIRLIILATFVILVVRLFLLQVLSPEFEALAMSNAVDRKVIYPDRGIIFDRNGKAILENTLTHDLMILPTQLKGIDTIGLCNILGIDTSEFRQKLITAIIKNGRYRPSVFEASLPVAKFVKLQENIYRFEPGFYLQDRPIRSYPQKAAAHLLGYIGEVDSSILRRTNYYYQMGDYLGLTGLERYYESILMGQRGIRQQIKDNHNRIVGSYNNGKYDTAAIAGRNLRTYLDIDIQVLAEKLMSNKLGAVVALEPKTGGIIAMASGPSYDPNLLTGSERRRNFSWLLTDTARPLFNRAIQGVYPPGSTVKPMGAIIALDEGVITPSYGYPCSGAYYGCRRPIKCTHAGGGHASDLRRALANSCNSYFSHIYRLAVDNPQFDNIDAGYTKWKQYANSFGLGVRLGVDLPSEKGGLIADTSFYNKLYRNSWNSCTNVFLGIGQGEMTASPLQMANLMCIIANGGYYYTPHFVKEIDGKGEADTILNPFKVKHEVTHIPKEVYEVVQLGMQDVVDHGTARIAKLEGINVAAKTGTAENFGIINGKREKLEDHSWFVCFAPREDPKIAIAVIVENAGYGATWAGPVASILMEKFLNDTIRTERLKEVERISAKEIILPIVKQKRMRLDSLRRVRLALEMGDSSVLHNSLPAAPEKPTLDINIRKEAPQQPIRNNILPKKDSSDPKDKKPDTSKPVAILTNNERKKT
ncbi:penicillin-binding protein 2 [Pollutibacter soli]|uniref:penicillin-binding protein 2 n=1 Tax=Pollutibacter soli TaxID=3034157 RepID=UPI0030136260